MATKQPAMRPTGEPVDDVLDRAAGPRRAEADRLREILAEISGEEPVVWASRIIGFGEVEYRYESGLGGRMPVLAYSPASRQHTRSISRAAMRNVGPTLLPGSASTEAARPACISRA